MNFSQSIQQSEAPQFRIDGAGFASFVEEGICSLRQGQWKKSIALFTLARAHPQAPCSALVEILDALLACLERSSQAQQALHEASKRFVEAESEQELLLQGLQHTMQDFLSKPAMVYNTDTSHTASQAQALNVPSPFAASFPVAVSSQTDMQELALTVSCFGRFTVKRGQHPVNLGTNRNGQVILRYLIAQPEYSACKDALMGLIWPDLPEESARRRLQVAISVLRCALNEGCLQDTGGGYILYQEPRYLLNPAIPVLTDIGEFVTLWKTGRHSEEARCIACFEQACALYTAPFMADDLFADWTYLQREEFNRIYLTMCHTLVAYYLRTGTYMRAAQKCQTILKDNRCDELAHRQLMRIYALQSTRNEAIRQYQQCAYLLEKELGVSPLPETQHVFQAIIAGTPLPEELSPL